MLKRNLLQKSKTKPSIVLGQREQGAVTMSGAIIMSGVLLAGVTAVQKMVGNRQATEGRTTERYYLETANETAIALTSQLLGNSTVIPNAGNFTTNPGVRPGDSTAWRLVNNKLEISSCLRPASSLSPNSIYTNVDSTNQLTSCDPQAMAKTVVSVMQRMNDMSMEYFQEGAKNDYVQVEAFTTLGTNTLKKTARLRFAETTKVCDLNDPNNANACNVDHCKFTLPLRDPSKNVMYQADGRVEIQINPNFSERMRLQMQPAQTAMQKVLANDPDPTDLRAFYDKAYTNGRKDPFKTWQSVKPSVGDVNYVQVDPDGSVWLNVPNDRTVGGRTRGVPRFDGFLVHSDGTSSHGSSAINWPAGYRYSQLAGGLKNGCRRTLGLTGGPDLCARINVDIKGTNYAYAQRRSCEYEGPQDYPAFLQTGLRSWKESSADEYQKISDWTPTEETRVGERVIKDSRKVWMDDMPHHEFGPRPSYALHQSTRHVFNDIKVGEVIVREVKSAGSRVVTADCSKSSTQGDCERVSACDWTQIEVASADPAPVNATAETVANSDATTLSAKSVSTETAPSTDPVMGCIAKNGKVTEETFVTRDKVYNFDTRCEFRDATASDSMGRDVEICFYLTYFDIQNRNSCQRQVSDLVCRNQNGCFVAGTKILMADGSEKNIEDMQKGDLILNPSTRKAGLVQRVAVGEEKSDLYTIEFGGGSVTATHNHPFVTKSGMKQASQLVVGDLIADKDLQHRAISKISKKAPPEGTMVWNLIVSNPDGSDSTDFSMHTFVANGLTSGDYFIQQSLSYMREEHREFTKFLNSRNIH